MPVARGPQINARSALLVGATGIVIALLLGGMALFLTNRGGGSIRLGDTTFRAGQVNRIADEIDDQGPILYPDLGTNGTRDLMLQHIGDDPEVGWLAFSVRRAGDPRECFVAWDDGSRTLTLGPADDSRCEPVTFDEFGCGLRRYPVEVIDGEIEVFLNEDFDEVAEALGAEAPSQAGQGPDLSCPPG